MSKSYGNAIYLSDTPEQIRKKVMQMITDPQRAKRSDPGNPDVCNVYEFHKLYTDAETTNQINSQCRTAEIGCVECKKIMVENLIQALAPIYEKRQYYESHPDMVTEIMEEGSRKAREIACSTMQEVRETIKVNY